MYGSWDMGGKDIPPYNNHMPPYNNLASSSLPSSSPRSQVIACLRVRMNVRVRTRVSVQ